MRAFVKPPGFSEQECSVVQRVVSLLMPSVLKPLSVFLRPKLTYLRFKVGLYSLRARCSV